MFRSFSYVDWDGKGESRAAERSAAAALYNAKLTQGETKEILQVEGNKASSNNNMEITTVSENTVLSGNQPEIINLFTCQHYNEEHAERVLMFVCGCCFNSKTCSKKHEEAAQAALQRDEVDAKTEKVTVD